MDGTLRPFDVTTMPSSALMKEQEDCKAYMDGFTARNLSLCFGPYALVRQDSVNNTT
jgi:hypothetical protein